VLKIMSNTQPIEAIEAEGAIQALHIPVALIDRDPAQPRTHFDEAALAELAESIRAHGVIQPIEVEATGDGRYRLHHGERRWRAAALAGRETIPAVVTPPLAADEKLVRQALENLHREDLNPIEEARVYQGLIDHGWARLRIARETGKSLPLINGRLAWLKLEPEVQRLVALGHLSKDGRLAEKLYVLPPEARVPLAQKIAAKHLGAKGAIRAAQALAEKLAQREAAETEGAARRPTITVASRPLHPTPMVRTAVPYANGSGPAPVATLAQASEAMCRSCVFMPKGNVIPSWELLAQVAAET
jgi:ParB family chromosome partitioning protein